MVTPAPASFLETLLAQQIPADTLADRGVRGRPCGCSPRTAPRGSSGGSSSCPGPGGQLARPAAPVVPAAAPTSIDGRTSCVAAASTARALLAEERRLFYVACTRARQRLLVTAVASPDDDGDQPSRFTDELGVESRRVQGRPPRPLSLAGLVADLRRTAADPRARRRSATPPPAGWPARAARRHGEAALVPAADPATWWGTRAAGRAPSGRSGRSTSR